MAHLVTTNTLVDAWIGGALHVLDNGPTRGLFLDVSSPDQRGGGRVVSRRIDQFLIDAQEMPSHTVAETIFPALEYRRHGIGGVFDVYPEEIYPKIKGHPKVRWGTYAYRLVRRRHVDGLMFNPLECIVDAMRRSLTPAQPCAPATNSVFRTPISISQYMTSLQMAPGAWAHHASRTCRSSCLKVQFTSPRSTVVTTTPSRPMAICLD